MSKPRILIVDDEPEICRAIAKVAEQCGYAPTIASDWKQRPAGHYDVMVLDLMMPRMDGIEVLRQLALDAARAQIILVSGLEDRILQSARRVAAKQGLDVIGVVKKPFHPAALKEHLQAAGIVAHHAPAAYEALPSLVTAEEIQEAISKDAFFFEFQPQMRLSNQAWVGVESLVRWMHPVHGRIPPSDFVSLAESPVLARAFSYAVVRGSLKGFGQLIDMTGFEGRISINIAPSALDDENFPDRILEWLRSAGVNPERLILEITETSLTENAILGLDIQTRLRMNGIGLAIDDFGMGHSSLERLHDSPFDELKIDKLFVNGATTDTSHRLIVENTIALAHSLSMTVVAEGVENKETMDWLASVGCDLIQGYYFSRPLPIAGIYDWAVSQAAKGFV